MKILRSQVIIAIAILALFFLAGEEASASIQTPWKSNEHGTLREYKEAYDYTVGYRFSSSVSGQIVRLGGYFEGEKLVKIWDADTGEVITSATVPGQKGAWTYVDISPIRIERGKIYILGAYMGNGAVKRYGITPFPQTYDDITIHAAMAGYGNSLPNEYISGTMAGQVDIGFISYADIYAIKPVSRRIQKIGPHHTRITLNIDLPYYTYRACGIVEHFPAGGEAVNLSHKGVIKENRIEWVASDFTDLPVGRTQVSYEVIKTGNNHIYDGMWYCPNPRTIDFISGDFSDAE